MTNEEDHPDDEPYQKENDISLSVYNTPEMLAKRRYRPMTTQAELLRKLPGYKPPAQPAEGEEMNADLFIKENKLFDL